MLVGWMLVACAGPVPATGGPGPESIVARTEGRWTGALDVGQARLTLVVHLERAGDGWTGRLDSPDQGAFGMPLEAVAPSDTGLSFAVPQVGGAFRGTWTADGGLRGHWSQGPGTLPLELARSDTAPTPRSRPQDPVPPLPYAEVEVAVQSAPGVVLAGTLTVPPGDGPHPAVVLVTGSGAQDRDESLMGHRPFRVLADALTRAGVAVLRCDDRGFGASTGDFAAATTHDFAVDAAAAIAHLAGVGGIDPKRVGVLGHSEGAWVAALAAADVPVAFVVLMAGPGISGRAVLESQVEAHLLASGLPAAAAAQARASQAAILEVVARGGTAAELRAAMQAAGVPEAQIGASVEAMGTSWYRTFVRHDPAPSLAALTVPVLAVIGGLDTQVVPAENEPALRAALAGNPDATVRVLPGLNHLQPAGTGLIDEYGTIETTIDPGALALIVAWVVARAGGGR